MLSRTCAPAKMFCTYSLSTCARVAAVGATPHVAARLEGIIGWGVDHLICTLGAQPFTLWSDEAFDLFAREVLPRLRDVR